MIYLDSSALIKNYSQEPGTHRVREILSGADGCSISKIGYAEVCAAFGRKNRENPKDRRIHLIGFQRFQEDWKLLSIVELADDLLPVIRSVTEKYPLRGADAIHLASALWLERVLHDEGTFVAADTRLLEAAQSERLKVINPETNNPTHSFNRMNLRER